MVERSDQLRQERNFSDAVQNTAASLILVIDTEGRMVRFNRACADVTGYNFEELVGTKAWLTLMPEEERGQVERVMKRLMSGEALVEDENHWLTRDGSRRLLIWRTPY